VVGAVLSETLIGSMYPKIRLYDELRRFGLIVLALVQVTASHVAMRVWQYLRFTAVVLRVPAQVWRLRYQDVNDMWRGCGAVWLATTGGDGAMLVEDEEEKEKGGGTEEEDGDASDGSDDEDDEEAEATKVHLQRNLRSALNVVGACFRRG